MILALETVPVLVLLSLFCMKGETNVAVLFLKYHQLWIVLRMVVQQHFHVDQAFIRIEIVSFCYWKPGFDTLVEKNIGLNQYKWITKVLESDMIFVLFFHYMC